MFGVHTIMRPAASQDNDLILSLPVPFTTYCDIITGRGQSCSQEMFLLSNPAVFYQRDATKGLSSKQKMPLSMFHLTLPVGWWYTADHKLHQKHLHCWQSSQNYHEMAFTTPIGIKLLPSLKAAQFAVHAAQHELHLCIWDIYNVHLGKQNTSTIFPNL